MASSSVEICNKALLRVRAGAIQELTENSAEADACRILYPMLRDQLLEKYPFGFARAFRALALTLDETVEWKYCFDYPNDSLKARYLTFDGYDPKRAEPIPYEIGKGTSGRVILTNIPEPTLVYTCRLEDVRQYSESFVDALAWFMAIDLAPIVGGESANKYADRAANAFPVAWTEAIAHDGNESQPEILPREPKAIRARHDTNRRNIYPDWRGE